MLANCACLAWQLLFLPMCHHFGVQEGFGQKGELLRASFKKTLGKSSSQLGAAPTLAIRVY